MQVLPANRLIADDPFLRGKRNFCGVIRRRVVLISSRKSTVPSPVIALWDDRGLVLIVWLQSGWLIGAMAWVGSLVASVQISMEVQMSLNVDFSCVMKFAVLGAQLEKNRSTQVAFQP